VDLDDAIAAVSSDRDRTNPAQPVDSSNDRGAHAVARTIEHIAPTNISVLLIGESGTGKEFLANQIHRLSLRSTEPLRKVICASATAESLSAHFTRKSDEKNSASNAGTLFLKEISELDAATQRSLLYSLPQTDVGAQAGPRLISSTIVNLEQEIRAAHFRAELYYRINGTCLRLLPLRRRKEEIPEIADLLLAKHAKLQGRPEPRLDAEDYVLLQQFSWPGNIRELENVIKKVVILNDAKLVLSELSLRQVNHRPAAPVETRGSVLKTATRAASRKAERQLILDALARTRWNRKRAAQELQISYKALLYKLKEIGPEDNG
jgi:two-component system response regulator AtoC